MRNFRENFARWWYNQNRVTKTIFQIALIAIAFGLPFLENPVLDTPGASYQAVLLFHMMLKKIILSANQRIKESHFQTFLTPNNLMNVKLQHGIMPIVVLEKADESDELQFVLDNETYSELMMKQEVAMKFLSEIQRQLYEYFDLMVSDTEGEA